MPTRIFFDPDPKTGETLEIETWFDAPAGVNRTRFIHEITRPDNTFVRVVRDVTEAQVRNAFPKSWLE